MIFEEDGLAQIKHLARMGYYYDAVKKALVHQFLGISFPLESKATKLALWQHQGYTSHNVTLSTSALHMCMVAPGPSKGTSMAFVASVSLPLVAHLYRQEHLPFLAISVVDQYQTLVSQPVVDLQELLGDVHMYHVCVNEKEPRLLVDTSFSSAKGWKQPGIEVVMDGKKAGEIVKVSESGAVLSWRSEEVCRVFL